MVWATTFDVGEKKKKLSTTDDHQIWIKEILKDIF